MFIKIEERYNGPFVMKNGKAVSPDKKIIKIINLMNANSIIFQKDKNENFGILNIIFNDKTITIDNISTIEWSKIEESLKNGGKQFMDLTKLRTEARASLNNHSEQLNPNNFKFQG